MPDSSREAALLALDLGGTNTALALLDAGRSVLSEHSLETRSGEGPAALLARCLDWARGQGPLPARLAIGAPNGDPLTRRIVEPPNLPWGTVDLEQLLLSLADPAPCLTVCNDASAAAWGEATHGAGKGLCDFVQLTLGTGVGGGIIAGGVLQQGAQGFAGELGHLELEAGGRPCGCGAKGCLERYVSATGIRITARELGLPGEPGGRELETRARAGDRGALECWSITGARLGRGLAQVALVLNPQAFVISGGLSHAGDLLLEPARASLEAHLLPVMRGRIELRTSALPGSHAAFLGLAELAMKDEG